jgi:D-alanyl-D-alanine carboxypeptidase
MSNRIGVFSRLKRDRKSVVMVSLLLSVSTIGLTFGPISPASSEVFCIMPPCFETEQHSIDEAASPWVVVNKVRPLNPISYTPKVVAPPFKHPATHNPHNLRLTKEAGIALVKLAQAAKDAGAGSLFLQSGYRSYSTQKAVHARQVSRLGLKAGEALAARPGFSEHQTGLAADVGAVGQGCLVRICFATTKMGKWLAKNAYLYGFIIRYPEGKTSITGYQFEPWHLRFVGEALASEMQRQNEMVLENFWGLDPAPTYLTKGSAK